MSTNLRRRELREQRQREMEDIERAVAEERYERRAELREETSETLKMLEEFIEAKILAVTRGGETSYEKLDKARSRFIERVVEVEEP